MTSKFQVGQKVTVVDCRGDAVRQIATVSSTGARKLKLSDNSEWKHDGSKPYGSTLRWYTGPYVREYRDGDEALLQRGKDIKVLERFSRWRELTNEELHALAELLRAAHVARIAGERR